MGGSRTLAIQQVAGAAAQSQIANGCGYTFMPVMVASKARAPLTTPWTSQT